MLDSHCHLLMECSAEQIPNLTNCLNEFPNLCFALMSTNQIDLPLVDEIATLVPSVVPYYGIHPWYSHLFSAKSQSKVDHYNSVLQPPPSPDLIDILPHPIPLETHIEEIHRIATARLQKGLRFGIGECGLDKSFRIPSNGYYGNQHHQTNVSLTNCKVSMDHQLLVFSRQLALANSLKKPVSLHCVKAHGAFYDLLAKSSLYDDIPAVVLHSYTGSIDQAKQWLRAYSTKKSSLLFSFSNYINAADNKLSALADLLALLEDHQILTETDMPLDRFLPHRKHEYIDHDHGITTAIATSKQWSDAPTILHHNNASLYTPI